MSVNRKKKPVRFTAERDLKLMRLVLGNNSFKNQKRWTGIAEEMTLPEFVVDARRVRERTMLLLSNFAKENNENIAKSGEEEHVDEFTVLLQESYDLRREAVRQAKGDSEKKENKKKSDEEIGKDVRKRALQGFDNKESKSKRCKLSAIEFLQEKHNQEAQLKEKELEPRKRELDLQERRFEMERVERQSLIDIRKRQSEAMVKMLDKIN